MGAVARELPSFASRLVVDLKSVSLLYDDGNFSEGVQMVWAPAVTAVSVAVIAGTLLFISGVFLFWIRDVNRLTRNLEQLSDFLSQNAGPALRSAKDLVNDASRMAVTLRREADELADTSRMVRGKVKKAASAIEDRLVDLDTLVEVAQGELEETVLDVTAALRTGRRSASLLRSLRRAFRGRKR